MPTLKKKIVETVADLQNLIVSSSIAELHASY
jgi:hypothetical protein